MSTVRTYQGEKGYCSLPSSPSKVSGVDGRRASGPLSLSSLRLVHYSFPHPSTQTNHCLPPPKLTTAYIHSHSPQTPHGLSPITPHALYVVLSALWPRHHAHRASRSAIVRAFHRTYIITGDPRNTLELRERPLRLRLMLSDCPVRTPSRRTAHHNRQRTPSISHHEAAFTGRTLYSRVLCFDTVLSRGGTGRVHAGWPCEKSQPAPTATAIDTLLTVLWCSGANTSPTLYIPPRRHVQHERICR